MTRSDAVSSAEWRLLARTPVDAMFAVVVTSYGGIRRELHAIRRTLRHADDFPVETELVSELVGFVRVNADRLRRDASARDLHREVVRARALDDCRESTRVLRRVATVDERAEFGHFVLYCAERTALASAEGGLLKGSASRLAPAEDRFLDSLATALDVERRN